MFQSKVTNRYFYRTRDKVKSLKFELLKAIAIVKMIGNSLHSIRDGLDSRVILT